MDALADFAVGVLVFLIVCVSVLAIVGGIFAVDLWKDLK